MPENEVEELLYPASRPVGDPSPVEYQTQFRELVTELLRQSNLPYEVQHNRASAKSALAREDFKQARTHLTAAAESTRRAAEHAGEEYARSLAALGALAFTVLDFGEARVRYGMALLLPGLSEERFLRYCRSYIVASNA